MTVPCGRLSDWLAAMLPADLAIWHVERSRDPVLPGNRSFVVFRMPHPRSNTLRMRRDDKLKERRLFAHR